MRISDWSSDVCSSDLDPNPIHLDVEVVKAKGLGDKVINQGPANVAYVMNMLAAAFPGSRIEKMDSRFVDNVYAGDRLTAGGTVTGTDEGRAFCDVWLRAAARDIVIYGTATRSEERRVGKEWFSTCRSRWSRSH